MGKIKNVYGNTEVSMSFSELLEKGFPQGFAILNWHTGVPELLAGDMDNMISFQQAFTALAARIVREKLEKYNGKMPSRGYVTLEGDQVTITLGGWHERPPLHSDYARDSSLEAPEDIVLDLEGH